MNLSQIERLYSDLADLEKQTGRLANKKFSSSGHSFLLSIENQIPIFSIECTSQQASKILKLSFNSLNLLSRKFTLENDKEKEYFVLSLKKPQDLSVFIRVIESIIYDFERKRGDSVALCLANLKKWKSFWDSNSSRILSEQEMLGLFGELYFIKQVHTLSGKIVIDCWTGPLGAEHDFILNAVDIEIKSSKSSLGFISISSLKQLESADGKELVLIVYDFREGGTESKSLKEMVYLVEDLLDSDESELLWRRLNRLGYRLDDESFYAASKYVLSKATIYNVIDGFPRLTNKSFGSPLDSRIRGVTYSLELKGLDRFEIRSLQDYIKGISL